MGLTQQERVMLVVVGIAGFLGLGVLWRQNQQAPIRMGGESNAVQQARQWDHALAMSRQVDINAASAAELERLPDVGPSLANRIVEYRTAHGPFQSSEELAHVKGIGPKIYGALADYVTVK